jgi:hypothetical protein
MNDPLVNGIYQPPLRQYQAIGYGGALQQWYETNFDPTSGYTNRVEYKALNWNHAVELANYFTALGISANLKNENGCSTLTITDATGNYVIDKWELSVDREQPEMFENPKFLSLINQAAQPSLAIYMMRQQLKSGGGSDFNIQNDSGWYSLVQLMQPSVKTSDPVSGLPTVWNNPTLNPTAVQFINFALGASFYGAPPGNDGTPPTGTGATLDWTSANMIRLKQYFDSYQLGVTNFMRGKYKLRHTSNIPAKWNVSVADFNVERIYTIPQLLAECTGSGFIYPLPNYLAYKISNFIPDPVPSWIPFYTWGALKEKSDANTAVNNRIELVTMYDIDNINNILYNTI